VVLFFKQCGWFSRITRYMQHSPALAALRKSGAWHHCNYRGIDTKQKMGVYCIYALKKGNGNMGGMKSCCK
jgi:hypothetical protein